MPTKQILVVAPPGRLQEGIQILLATLPDADIVVVANTDAAQAHVALRPPHLAIIAGDHAERTLAAIVDDCPATRFLLFVRHAHRKAAAEAAGADVVMVEGTPARRLLGVVRRLLADASADQTEVRQ